MYVSCWMDSARRFGGGAERIPFFASAPPVVSGKSSPCLMRLLDGSSSGSRRAASDERSPCRYRCRSWRELPPDELAADALMESLGQVVRHELVHHVPQVSLAEEDEFVQALVLDRLHEPLGVRIAVRTARWEHRASSCLFTLAVPNCSSRVPSLFTKPANEPSLHHLGQQRVAQ